MSIPRVSSVEQAEEVARHLRRRRILQWVPIVAALAVLGLVTLALPWAEAAVDDWADHEEAKAAQAWRRTP